MQLLNKGAYIDKTFVVIVDSRRKINRKSDINYILYHCKTRHAALEYLLRVSILRSNNHSLRSYKIVRKIVPQDSCKILCLIFLPGFSDLLY